MISGPLMVMFFFFQAEDGIRDVAVTGVQTCALPICRPRKGTHAGEPSQVTSSTRSVLRLRRAARNRRGSQRTSFQRADPLGEGGKGPLPVASGVAFVAVDSVCGLTRLVSQLRPFANPIPHLPTDRKSTRLN